MAVSTSCGGAWPTRADPCWQSDQAVGLVLLLASTVAFVLYTFWVLATPFYPEGHFVPKWFPAPELAVAAPLLVLVAAATFVLTFVALVMIRGRPEWARARPPAPSRARPR